MNFCVLLKIVGSIHAHVFGTANAECYTTDASVLGFIRGRGREKKGTMHAYFKSSHVLARCELLFLLSQSSFKFKIFCVSSHYLVYTLAENFEVCTVRMTCLNIGLFLWSPAGIRCCPKRRGNIACLVCL